MKIYYKLFLFYIGILLFVTLGVYSVFSTDLFFDAQIINSKSLSKNIYLDDSNLNSDIIFYESNNDLSEYNVISSCNISSKFAGNKGNVYYFKIKFLNNKCDNQILFLAKNGKVVKKSLVKLNLFSKNILFDFYSNKNTNELKKILKNIDFLISKNLTKLEKTTGIKNVKIKRLIKELKYQKKLVKKILLERQKKYISAVKGYKISRQKNKIPNAGRPYRAGYTDGIHHGWDIPAPIGTKTRALAYGKIIRIVDGFKFSDLGKIRKGNLSFDDKIINLDILRGNQVWLKTAKGDVLFYSHLKNIPKGLKVGDLVEVGTFLGEVGISGVPDRHYKDIHLHLPIMKNPRNKKEYSFLDIMKWDWYFKGKSLEYVLEHQNEIFTNE